MDTRRFGLGGDDHVDNDNDNGDVIKDGNVCLPGCTAAAPPQGRRELRERARQLRHALRLLLGIHRWMIIPVSSSS